MFVSFSLAKWNVTVVDFMKKCFGNHLEKSTIARPGKNLSYAPGRTKN